MALPKELLKSLPFVNLRTYSHYSMMLAVGTVKDHLKAAMDLGHKGMALTDNGSLAGAIQLYSLAREKNFPFALGANLFITEDILLKDPEHKYDRLVVFAKNWVGYQNLCRLISISSQEDHMYYRPRISFEELFQHKEGLIVSASDASSPFGHHILNSTGLEEELFLRFKEEFKDDFFVEISLADLSQRWNKELKAFIKEDNKQEIVNLRMLELSKAHGVKPYLTMPSYMPDKNQYLIQKISIANSPTGKDGWHFHEAQYTMSVEELYERAQKIAPYLSDEDFKTLCQNSVQVLEKAKDLQLELKPLLLRIEYGEHPVNQEPRLEEALMKLEEEFKEKDPEFSKLLKRSRHNENLKALGDTLPELKEPLKDFVEDKALRTVLKIVLQNKKIDLKDEVYRKRLTEELNVIQNNGVVRFCDYFLPIEDVVRFHRDNGYQRGFGRGSGGSSLVCYALDVSDVDPIKYNLLFSRFITLERLGRFKF